MFKARTLIAALAAITCTSEAAHAEVVDIGGKPFLMQPLQLGRGQHAVAAADFDADGNLDLAVTNADDAEVAIFRGNGRGAFEPAATHRAGANPNDVVARDFDGDGSLDLIIANHETTYVTLLQGRGDGTFRSASASPLQVSVSPHPHTVAVEDLDRDGVPDIIVDHREGRGLMVMRGLKGGRFQPRGDIVAVGGDPYLGFAVGDVNGDGRPDLVSPNENDVAVVLSDTQRARFSSPVFLPMPRPFAVALGDFNRDSYVDVVAASESGDSGVQIFLGTRSGIPAKTPSARWSLKGGAKRIAVGDINGDGTQDVVIANWTAELRVAFGGQLQKEMLDVPLGTLRNPYALIIEDLNKDGRGDLVVTDGTLPIAVVYWSQ